MSRVALIITARSRNGVGARGLLRLLFVLARVAVAKAVSPAAADFAFSIRSPGSQCAHRQRTNLSDALLTRGHAGKPIGHIREGRLHPTDHSGCRRGANRSFSLLKRPAAGLESQSGGGGAASGAQTGTKRSRLSARPRFTPLIGRRQIRRREVCRVKPPQQQ